MKRGLLVFFLSLFAVFNAQEIVLSTKQIDLSPYSKAFNPSLIRLDEGYLLSFRYVDEFDSNSSYIGVVVLDSSFEKITQPQLLATRTDSNSASHAEDARLFEFRGRLFVIYNDNVDGERFNYYGRRDMFISEFFSQDGRFQLSAPIKMVSKQHYPSQIWQKNWIPFEWDETLLLVYSINPHQILYPNLRTGECFPYFVTQPDIHWEHGTLRGSTPAKLIDGEYLAFFHSGVWTSSEVSYGFEMWHYYMGAYTFAAEPPFEITKISSKPIHADGFYTPSSCWKRVIFPGGFISEDSYIYLAYGKDDCEVWIAVLDYHALKQSLVSHGGKT